MPTIPGMETVMDSRLRGNDMVLGGMDNSILNSVTFCCSLDQNDVAINGWHHKLITYMSTGQGMGD